jgi:hypothetical protein
MISKRRHSFANFLGINMHSIYYAGVGELLSDYEVH